MVNHNIKNDDEELHGVRGWEGQDECNEHTSYYFMQ